MGTGESKITTAQYWREVASLAKEAKREAKSRGEELSDVVHELVDGHEWIIYTWAYPWVLMHTDNEDALFDTQGPVEATNYSQIMQLMTFYALEQDVYDRISG